MMEEQFILQSGELSGIDLSGWKSLSGVIQLEGTKPRYIPAWPEEIYCMGATYTLEYVIDGDINTETGALFQDAVYV